MRMVLRATADEAMRALQVAQGSTYLHPQGIQLRQRYLGGFKLPVLDSRRLFLKSVHEVRLANVEATFQEIPPFNLQIGIFFKKITSGIRYRVLGKNL